MENEKIEDVKWTTTRSSRPVLLSQCTDDVKNKMKNSLIKTIKFLDMVDIDEESIKWKTYSTPPGHCYGYYEVTYHVFRGTDGSINGKRPTMMFPNYDDLPYDSGIDPLKVLDRETVYSFEPVGQMHSDHSRKGIPQEMFDQMTTSGEAEPHRHAVNEHNHPRTLASMWKNIRSIKLSLLDKRMSIRLITTLWLIFPFMCMLVLSHITAVVFDLHGAIVSIPFIFILAGTFVHIGFKMVAEIYEVDKSRDFSKAESVKLSIKESPDLSEEQIEMLRDNEKIDSRKYSDHEEEVILQKEVTTHYGKFKDTGAYAIMKERLEQIMKHKISVSSDVLKNKHEELIQAAIAILDPTRDFPSKWGPNICRHIMTTKSKEDRLIIAGALIAAEIDRLRYLYEQDLARPSVSPYDLRERRPVVSEDSKQYPLFPEDAFVSTEKEQKVNAEDEIAKARTENAEQNELLAFDNLKNEDSIPDEYFQERSSDGEPPYESNDFQEHTGESPEA